MHRLQRELIWKKISGRNFAKSGIAEAIAKAKEVAQKEKVTKLEIKEADDALKKALGKLDEVKASGKTEVQTKIAQAAEKKEADYTKESWANFAKAKRDAEMAFASETATAKQLKDAADALDIAMKHWKQRNRIIITTTTTVIMEITTARSRQSAA